MKQSPSSSFEQVFIVESWLAKTYDVSVTTALDPTAHELAVGYKSAEMTVGWDARDENKKIFELKPSQVTKVWPITEELRRFDLGPGENTNGVEKKPRIHPGANTMIKFTNEKGETGFAFIKTRLDDVFNDGSHRREARTTLLGALGKTIAGITGHKERPITIPSASAEASLLMACADRIKYLGPAPEKRVDAKAERDSRYYRFSTHNIS